MVLETIEILDDNLSLTLEQLQTKITNGDYDDLLKKYNILTMTTNGLTLIDKNNKMCNLIAPIDLNNYVKNTDYASSTKAGVVRFNNAFGIGVNNDGYVHTVAATINEINKKQSSRYPIVPNNLDYAVRSVYPITQTSITDAITTNTIYDLGLQTTIDITLPSGKTGDFIQFDFVSGETATSLTINSTNGLIGYDFNPEVNKIYSLYFDYGIIGYSNDVINYGWRFKYSDYTINN